MIDKETKTIKNKKKIKVNVRKKNRKKNQTGRQQEKI